MVADERASDKDGLRHTPHPPGHAGPRAVALNVLEGLQDRETREVLE